MSHTNDITVTGPRWSPDTHELRDFLARNRIPYRFRDADRSTDLPDDVALPQIELADGTRLVRPTLVELGDACGLHTHADNPFYDLVVVGGGPAGLSAAVYGASEGLSTALIEREATGGQAGTSSKIENYLGFPEGVSGAELADRAMKQALKFGAEIIEPVEVVGITVDRSTRVVALSDGSEIGCHAIVLAGGMTVRRLEAPGHEQHLGAGIYYGAAPGEAASYADADVVVVGAANSAGQAAVMLSKRARSVTMVIRGETVAEHMSQYLVDHIAQIPNIEVIPYHHIVAYNGNGHLESIDIENVVTGELRTLETTGLFIFIGFRPHSDILQGLIALDAHGFVLTGRDAMTDTWPLEREPYPMETSVPGIFAAGDIRADVVRRVASAVGQGAVCVSFVHQYLEKR